jgi:hypothetical protein
MSASFTVSLLAAAVAVTLCGDLGSVSVDGTPRESRTEVMAFADCVSMVEEISSEMGVRPISILRTGDVWLTRIEAFDGAVTVTCNRPDRLVTLKRVRNEARMPDSTGSTSPSPKG